MAASAEAAWWTAAAALSLLIWIALSDFPLAEPLAGQIRLPVGQVLLTPALTSIIAAPQKTAEKLVQTLLK